MTPDQLQPADFAAYPPLARQFAMEHLALLRRLPLSICPSFLQQIQEFDTLFPAERNALRLQCNTLGQMPPAHLAQLTAPLASITLSSELARQDWVRQPARFVNAQTAFLWSSAQIDAFRNATLALFAAIPVPQDTAHRLVVVVLGKDASVDPTRLLRKLRREGVTLNALQHQTAFADIGRLLHAHSSDAADVYAAWYVDGGEPRRELAQAIAHGTSISYPALDGVREHVLTRMKVTLNSGAGGPEQMRAQMHATSVAQSGVEAVTSDPVLQRFYEELFTNSSGPQIFSTSFVQWTGRELARRAQPRTLALRYTPRRQHQDMNTMFADQTPPTLDPQGSLLDAEMGAYYHWIEMGRITAPGKLTVVAWAEDQPLAVIVSPNAPAGVTSSTPMTLAKAVASFG